MQIEREAALTVAMLEIIRAGAMLHDAHRAHVIAFQRPLDFDYVGAEFTHYTSAGRTGHEMGEVEDAVTFEHQCLLLIH